MIFYLDCTLARWKCQSISLNKKRIASILRIKSIFDQESPIFFRPPSGCLQYHLGTDGRFTTFNFAAEGGHLPNQRYNICLRREQGTYRSWNLDMTKFIKYNHQRIIYYHSYF